MYRLTALSRAATRPALKTLPATARQSFVRAPIASFHTNKARFAAPESNDSFLQGNAGNYIEEMYEAWLREPSSVHLSWQVYFKNMANGVAPSQAYSPPPTIVPSASARLPVLPGAGFSGASSDVIDHMKIQLLTRAYQVRGHHLANLDPLGIQHADLQSTSPPELEYSYYGFREQDLDRQFTIGPGILPAFTGNSNTLTLREIIDHLKKIYCKSRFCFYLFIYIMGCTTRKRGHEQKMGKV
jgi:2-oxoglutarate dehydrogenase E1 component